MYKVFVNENVILLTSEIPFGSKIFVKDGEEVKANQTLAEWDPYTLPIIA